MVEHYIVPPHPDDQDAKKWWMEKRKITANEYHEGATDPIMIKSFKEIGEVARDLYARKPNMHTLYTKRWEATQSMEHWRLWTKICVIVGCIMAVLGFVLWYIVVQRTDDKIRRLQLKEFQATAKQP
jgi:hypothetical protein